uniref:Uncharacterized protein n=1 Tax=Romanomermis culicivorax TaxID=13658 RepID=A0A915J994_ROMCU
MQQFQQQAALQSQRCDTNLRFTQIYPEDSEDDPESNWPANLINAVTTRSMGREAERKDQAIVA